MFLIEIIKSVIFGFVEGITEWLPISSTDQCWKSRVVYTCVVPMLAWPSSSCTARRSPKNCDAACQMEHEGGLARAVGPHQRELLDRDRKSVV